MYLSYAKRRESRERGFRSTSSLWPRPAPWCKMPDMGRRRRRKRHERGGAVRAAAGLARVMLVVVISVAVGYAFYLALSWVASEGARRSLGG